MLTESILEQVSFLPSRVVDAVIMLVSPPLGLANVLAQLLHAALLPFQGGAAA